MVFDTVVLAYALLGVPRFREESLKAIGKAKEIWVPDILFAELANVVWQWILHRGVPLKRGLQVLRDVESLVTEAVKSSRLSEYALDLAVSHRHPVYDTLFVALASARNTKVISYDKRLQTLFPDSVISVEDFLKTGGPAG